MLTAETLKHTSRETKLEYLAALEERAERQRVKQARQSTVAFFDQTSRYKSLRWQRHLGGRLDKLKYQTGQRILVHKPPQHGGSIFLTQRFIPWSIGNDPNVRVRLLTYNITRSTAYGTTILRIMQSDEYKKIFPDIDIPERTAAARWYTKQREAYNDNQESFLALGLETGFIGSGGDLVIIDDPYANDRDPFSDVVNAALRKTHNETIVPRLNPETNVIVMYHAWNPDDYGSWLKSQGIWEVITYPALAEENDILGRAVGEALAPELMPKDKLIELRDSPSGIGRAAFESLYQGNPTRRDGSLFKVGWFNYKKDFPRDEGRFVGAFDWASSDEPTADRTSYSLWYRQGNGKFYKVYAAFGRFNPSGTQQFIYNQCKYTKDNYGDIGKIKFLIEDGIGAGSDYVRSIQSYCAEFSIRAKKPVGDKETRALPLIAQMESGNVVIVEGSWNQECQREALEFPNGKHDDLVDSDTMAFNELAAKKGIQIG